jgi:hypothetical protein
MLSSQTKIVKMENEITGMQTMIYKININFNDYLDKKPGSYSIIMIYSWTKIITT